MDRGKYEVIPIRIAQGGEWIASTSFEFRASSFEQRRNAERETRNTKLETRVLLGPDPGQRRLSPMAPASQLPQRLVEEIDVVFPLTHGTYGEDGCLQGLLELAGLPYVGAGVLGSAVGMDKILMKTIFRARGFPVADFLPVTRFAWEHDPAGTAQAIEAQIGFPCFVKPSNLGSSVGISRVRARDELAGAVARAAEYGARLIVERAVEARELECGVLGSHAPAPSVVGEVIPARAFYDYEAKYHDARTQFVIPAELRPETEAAIQGLSLEAFEAIGCAGMARVDFFFAPTTGKVYLNEINTIPGFTSMSVYPRLWAASGVAYPQLIDRLIDLALERHRDEARNRTRYDPPPSPLAGEG
jgi:D-alanine-D-alanine ligase